MSKKITDLSALISERAADNLVREFEFEKGFVLTLKHLPRASAQRHIDSARIRKWNRDTHQREDALETEKLRESLLKDHLLGWRGLTIKILRSLVPMDPTAEVSDDDEVEFSLASAIMLAKHAPEFETFILDTVNDIGNFQRPSMGDELGN